MTNGLRILVLLLYWERPEMVRNALNSLKEMDYANWELAFIDDGSDLRGEPVVREILKNHLDQVRFFYTYDKPETKLARQGVAGLGGGGALIGLVMNAAVVTSDADLVIVLCDDDALVPTYFKNLNDWFNNNPNEMYGYSHVVTFDPTREDYHQLPIVARPVGGDINGHTGRIAGSCAVDSSQLAYRAACTKIGGVYWAYPQTGCLDGNYYEKLAAKYGLMPFMGFVGQYKGYFFDQMGRRGPGKPKIL